MVSNIGPEYDDDGGDNHDDDDEDDDDNDDDDDDDDDDDMMTMKMVWFKGDFLKYRICGTKSMIPWMF
ncbi:hypothetical protein ElyMa_004926200 [Elysia marginata]|uniref:Uncharacterized protein n=1 Tax=Elysia marginata TaxID=1093978 RepID=A0AAV4IXA9_9GAST|nr:hypothetical protein ElyMa_004926200 [Elysia marginata]